MIAITGRRCLAFRVRTWQLSGPLKTWRHDRSGVGSCRCRRSCCRGAGYWRRAPPPNCMNTDSTTKLGSANITDIAGEFADGIDPATIRGVAKKAGLLRRSRERSLCRWRCHRRNGTPLRRRRQSWGARWTCQSSSWKARWCSAISTTP